MFDLFVVDRSIRIERRGYGGEYTLQQHAAILNAKPNDKGREETQDLFQGRSARKLS
jgi:hypothetical protein